MNWRHVFDTAKYPYRNRDNAAQQAVDSHYVFMCWNGVVYFLSVGSPPDNKPELYETGITVGELV